MTGRIYSLNKVAVEGSTAHIAIDVAGGGDARSNRPKSPVELAAINVVASYGHARLEIRRVPLQENAVRPPAGCDPEEHHADDPEKKDRQDRNRQAECSSQVSLFDRLIHQRTGFRDASFHQVSLKFELLVRTQVDYGLKGQIAG